MTAIPSAQTNAVTVLPSYLYVEYSDDNDLQAFVASYNSIAQGYLDWFNGTPLPIYTEESISGLLLDWVGTYLYDTPRPIIGNYITFGVGATNTMPVDALPVDGSAQFFSGTAAPVDDDVYKRFLTWWLYSGDGKVTSVDWIKRRITRFMYGPEGADVEYPQPIPPSVTVGIPVVVGATNTAPVDALPVDGSGVVETPGFIITVPPGVMGTILQQLVAAGLLALPFENRYIVVLSNWLYDDGGVVALTFNPGYPTSMTGLAPGALWSNGGLVCVVPGSTPMPAPPVLFAGLNAITLLNIGGKNLPTSNPGPGSGQLWNNGGVVCVA